MIVKLQESHRDFNPNMFSFINRDIIKQLLKLLAQRTCERVLKIQLLVFEALQDLLTYLNTTNKKYLHLFQNDIQNAAIKVFLILICLFCFILFFFLFFFCRLFILCVLFLFLFLFLIVILT